MKYCYLALLFILYPWVGLVTIYIVASVWSLIKLCICKLISGPWSNIFVCVCVLKCIFPWHWTSSWPLGRRICQFSSLQRQEIEREGERKREYWKISEKGQRCLSNRKSTGFLLCKTELQNLSADVSAPPLQRNISMDLHFFANRICGKTKYMFQRANLFTKLAIITESHATSVHFASGLLLRTALFTLKPFPAAQSNTRAFALPTPGKRNYILKNVLKIFS